MRNHIVAILSLIGIIAVGTSFAAAQPGPGRSMGMPRYDASAERTVTGSVEAVQSSPSRMPMQTGVHFTLKTDSETFDVHVGPSWWLSDNKIEFAAGDRLEIVGSYVVVNGEHALIAREITKGDRKITLRDANGIPAWSGRGRRSGS